MSSTRDNSLPPKEPYWICGICGERFIPDVIYVGLQYPLMIECYSCVQWKVPRPAFKPPLKFRLRKK